MPTFFKEKKPPLITAFDKKYVNMLIKYYEEWQPWEDSPVTEYYANGQVKKEYMSRRANPLPSIVEFCRLNNLSYTSVNNWGTYYPEWDEAKKYCMEIRKVSLLNGGLIGMYSTPMVCFVATNQHGMKNTQHQNVNARVKSDKDEYDSMTEEELLKELEKLDTAISGLEPLKKEKPVGRTNKKSTNTKKNTVKKTTRKKTVRSKAK